MDDGRFPAIDLKDKCILVTGGTGSFGQRFVRRLVEEDRADRIVIYSRCEQRQYQMSHMPEFRDCPKLRFMIGDVRDRHRLEMATRGVDVIVHSAAMKHVPTAEYNPMECVKTNVDGAQNVVDVAIRNGVSKVIALSTDKACSPINLYGATKLASDKIVIAANNLSGAARTRFSVVRYGNVVNSNGSVLPLFRSLLAAGTDHLPITDARMTRFWITLAQGVDFVMTCLAAMKGGEVFVPKIPSMRITDLANALAPGLEQRIVGIRPGEKLHEAMITVDDARMVYDLGDRYVIEPPFAWWDRQSYSRLGYPRVAEDFSYTSATNDRWLSAEDLLEMLEH